jgi:hypothetical protein
MVAQPGVCADVQITFGIGGKGGTNNQLLLQGKKLQLKKLTDNSLPEVIALSGGRQVSRKFPVDLIFDAGHCDERGNDARPAAGFYYK